MGILKDLFTSRTLLIDVSLYSLHMFVVRAVGRYIEIDACIERKYLDLIIRDEQITIPGRIADEVRTVARKYNIKDVRLCVEDQKGTQYIYDDTVASSATELRIACKAENRTPSYTWIDNYAVDSSMYTTVAMQSKNLIDGMYAVVKSAGAERVTFYPRTQNMSEVVNQHASAFTTIVYEEKSVRVFSGIRGIVCFENVFLLGTERIVSEVKKLFSNADPSDTDIDTLLRVYGTDEATRKEAHKVHATIHALMQPVAIAVREQQKQMRTQYNQEEATVAIAGTIFPYVGIIDDLSIQIKTTIKKVDVWQGIINTHEHVPPCTKDKAHSYVPLVGLMRQMVRGPHMKPFDL